MPRPPIPELKRGEGREKEGGKGLIKPDLYGNTPDWRPLSSFQDSLDSDS